MLLHRVKLVCRGFWSQLLGNGESHSQAIAAQGVLDQQRLTLRNMRDASTSLIFQRKRLVDQLDDLDREIIEPRPGVQRAAVDEARRLLKAQVVEIEQDIETAHAEETQLALELIQAEQQLQALNKPSSRGQRCLSAPLVTYRS